MNEFDKFFVCGCSNSVGFGLWDAQNYYQKKLNINFDNNKINQIIYPYYVSNFFNLHLINYSTPGSGLEKLIRTTYGYINYVGLDRAKRTFFFLQAQESFSRLEMYSKTYGDFLTVGLDYNDKQIDKVYIIEKFLNKDKLPQETYIKLEDELKGILTNYFAPVDYEKKCINDFKGLCSYLKCNNIHFLISYDFNLDDDTVNLFRDNIFKVDGCNSIQSFAKKNNLRIIDETNGEIIDYHPGYTAHKLYGEELIKILQKKYY